MITREQLIPGKMYTLCGKDNSFPISMYVGTFVSELELTTVTFLWPLQSFVFLEMVRSQLISYPNEPWFMLKILTDNGIIGWIYVHDDDFKAASISFDYAKDLSKP